MQAPVQPTSETEQEVVRMQCGDELGQSAPFEDTIHGVVDGDRDVLVEVLFATNQPNTGDSTVKGNMVSYESYK